DRDLPLEPRAARQLLGAIRLVVDAPLAAGLPLEVLDRVRDVGLPAVNPRVGERAVEQLPRGPDERRAGEILLVARLLADEHHLGRDQPLAEDGLRRVR